MTIESQNQEPRITTVFGLIAEIAMANGVEKINQLPGCWEFHSGKTSIFVNGKKEPQRVTHERWDMELKPYNAAIFHNGWLVFNGDPGGGVVVVMTEEQLLAELQKILDEKAVTA